MMGSRRRGWRRRVVLCGDWLACLGLGGWYFWGEVRCGAFWCWRLGFGFLMVMVVLAVELCFGWFYWIPMVEVFVVLLILFIRYLRSVYAKSCRFTMPFAVVGIDFCGACCRVGCYN
jgi:hypothetical protein